MGNQKRKGNKDKKDKESTEKKKRTPVPSDIVITSEADLKGASTSDGRKRGNSNCRKNLQIEFNNMANTRKVVDQREGESDSSESDNSNSNAVIANERLDLEKEGVVSPRDLMKLLKRKKNQNTPVSTPKRKKFVNERQDLNQQDQQEILDYDDEIETEADCREDDGELIINEEEENSDLSDNTETITEIPEEFELKKGKKFHAGLRRKTGSQGD